MESATLSFTMNLSQIFDESLKSFFMLKKYSEQLRCSI